MYLLDLMLVYVVVLRGDHSGVVVVVIFTGSRACKGIRDCVVAFRDSSHAGSRLRPVVL